MELKERIEYIRKCIRHIDQMCEESGPDAIMKSFFTMSSVLYMLQTSIQAMINIGLRFLAEKGERPPQQYSDIGNILEECEVLTPSDAELFRKIVGFRNIIVHRYVGIDTDLLYKIVKNKLYHDILRISLRIVEEAENLGIDP